MGYYSFNRPRRDGKLSWPCWLTDSGRLTHKVVTRPAISLAQDRESSPARTGGLTTMLRQLFYLRSIKYRAYDHQTWQVDSTWHVLVKIVFLTSNKMHDQDVSCTIHLPSLVIICPVFFFCFRVLTHAYRADKRPLHADEYWSHKYSQTFVHIGFFQTYESEHIFIESIEFMPLT